MTQAVQEARKKILVVEDEGLIAHDIQRRLERLGYEVPAIASSGEEAIQLARSLEFDLVLMDIRLKGEMDGIAAAQRLKDELQAPVVYLTAHADADTVNRATVTEPFGYILKPIADGNLRSTLQIALYKHEMEHRLRVSEAWLSTTLRSMGDAILATDANGDIIFMNAVAERLAGSTADQAAGHALMDVLSLRDEPSGEPARNPVFDLLPDETRSYLLLSPDGKTTPVEAACFENRDNMELLGAIVVLRDIRSRTESDGRLIQSQRMDAIAALSRGMTGHLEGLLNTVLSQVDDLYSRLAGEDRAQVALVRRSASRAAAFSTQLSALGFRGEEYPAAIDVNQTIADFRESLSVCVGPRITIQTKLHANAGFIQADPHRFQQVLINLALHARDAMPDGGELAIETSILDLNAGDQDSRRYPNLWYVRLRVTHGGPEVDPAALAAIFEPSFAFETGTAVSRFGLGIAHRIVVQSGGDIIALGGAGKGVGFEIHWPCIGTHQGVLGLMGRFRDPVPAVLLVEEENALRRSMWCCLEKEGYQLLEAKTPEHAAMVSAAYRRQISALVAPLGAQQLSDRLRVPALYLSGYRHDRVPEPGVLSKPFPLLEFRRRIRALAETARPVRD